MYCLQIFDNDCGFAAFKNLLYLLKGHKRIYFYLTNPFINHNYSYYDLMAYGKKFGVTLEGFHVSSINDAITNKPFIAEIVDHHVTHAVTIKKVKNNFVYFIDPMSGKRKMKVEEFNHIFTGNILIVQNVEQNTRIKIKSFRVFPRLLVLGIFVFNIVNIFLTYFYSSSTTSLFIGLILLLVLNFICSKLFLFLVNRKTEKTMLKSIYASYIRKDKKIYEKVFEDKNETLATAAGKASSLITSIFLSIILITHSPVFIVPLVAIVLISFVSMTIMTTMCNRVQDDERYNRFGDYDFLCKKVNGVRIVRNLDEITKILIIALTIIFMIVIENSASINFGLFYFLSLYTYATNINDAIVYVYDYPKTIKMINRIDTYYSISIRSQSKK